MNINKFLNLRLHLHLKIGLTIKYPLVIDEMVYIKHLAQNRKLFLPSLGLGLSLVSEVQKQTTEKSPE